MVGRLKGRRRTKGQELRVFCFRVSWARPSQTQDIQNEEDYFGGKTSARPKRLFQGQFVMALNIA